MHNHNDYSQCPSVSPRRKFRWSSYWILLLFVGLSQIAQAQVPASPPPTLHPHLPLTDSIKSAFLAELILQESRIMAIASVSEIKKARSRKHVVLYYGYTSSFDVTGSSSLIAEDVYLIKRSGTIYHRRKILRSNLVSTSGQRYLSGKILRINGEIYSAKLNPFSKKERIWYVKDGYLKVPVPESSLVQTYLFTAHLQQ